MDIAEGLEEILKVVKEIMAHLLATPKEPEDQAGAVTHPEEEYNNKVEQTAAIYGSQIYETEKAILIKRADGLVKWIPKQYIIGESNKGKVIINEAGAWVLKKKWEEEKKNDASSS